MVRVDREKCTGCGACVTACPTGAIRLVNGVATVDADRCRECEVCMRACPVGAILPASAMPAEAPSAAEPVEQPTAPPQVITVEPRPVAVPSPPPAPGAWPWVGAALAFVGQEIVPRVAASLLAAWDRRRRPTPGTTQAPLGFNAGPSPLPRGGRGRQRRLRRRGRW